MTLRVIDPVMLLCLVADLVIDLVTNYKALTRFTTHVITDFHDFPWALFHVETLERRGWLKLTVLSALWGRIPRHSHQDIPIKGWINGMTEPWTSN
jgi:hypothetical protein